MDQVRVRPAWGGVRRPCTRDPRLCPNPYHDPSEIRGRIHGTVSAPEENELRRRGLQPVCKISPNP